jgi:hypothetical protein
MECGNDGILMVSQKVVTPVKTGVQVFCNPLSIMDPGFHRDDGKRVFSTFYGRVNIGNATTKDWATYLSKIHVGKSRLPSFRSIGPEFALIRIS